MNKRIRSLLLFFCTAVVLQARAQVSIFGGFQQTSALYNVRGVQQSVDAKGGFMAGAGIKTWIEGPAYFSPMIFYSQKGYKVAFNRFTNPPDSNAKNNDATIQTLEIAPLVQFNFSKKPSYVFLRVGPSIDFTLSGKESFDSTGGKRVTQKMFIDFSGYGYATASAVVHLGYQHKSGFTVFGYCEYGLSSFNNSDYGPEIYHRIYGAAIGWKFGKSR